MTPPRTLTARGAVTPGEFDGFDGRTLFTAIHEAGHVVVAATLGYPFEFVTVAPCSHLDDHGYAAGHFGGCRAPWENIAAGLYPDDPARAYWDAMVVSLAGGEAQRHFTGYRRGIGTDEEAALIAARVLYRIDRHDPAHPIIMDWPPRPTVRPLLNEARRRAADAVADAWPAVKATARALCDRTFLGAADVRALLTMAKGAR